MNIAIISREKIENRKFWSGTIENTYKSTHEESYQLSLNTSLGGSENISYNRENT